MHAVRGCAARTATLTAGTCWASSGRTPGIPPRLLRAGPWQMVVAGSESRDRGYCLSLWRGAIMIGGSCWCKRVTTQTSMARLALAQPATFHQSPALRLPVLKYLIERAEYIHMVSKQRSARQNEKIDEAMRANPERAAASETFRRPPSTSSNSA